MKRFVRAEEHANANPPYFMIVWAEDYTDTGQEPQPGGGFRSVLVTRTREIQEVRKYISAPEREAILSLIHTR